MKRLVVLVIIACGGFLFAHVVVHGNSSGAEGGPEVPVDNSHPIIINGDNNWSQSIVTNDPVSDTGVMEDSKLEGVSGINSPADPVTNDEYDPIQYTDTEELDNFKSTSDFYEITH